MKKFVISALVILSMLFAFTGCSTVDDTESNNTPVTEAKTEEAQQTSDTSVFGSFTAKDINGNEVTQEIFSKNKLTMVVFWGTFCGPCISSMPDLAALAAENAHKGFAVIGIPIDVTDDYGNINEQLYNEAKDIITEKNADYPHIIPSKEMMERKVSGVYSVPEIIFLDSSGNQVGRIYLGARTKLQWQVIIDNILEGMA